MNVVVSLEEFILMSREEAERSSLPTMLVEKTSVEVKSFVTMRTLFQLKKWTQRKQLIVLTAKSLDAYRDCDVFHIDAPPHWAIVENGEMVLRDNELDDAYPLFFKEQIAKGKNALESALLYIASHGETLVVATNAACEGFERVPQSLYTEDVNERTLNLFRWFEEKEKM